MPRHPTDASNLRTSLRRKSGKLSIEDEINIYNFLLSYLAVHGKVSIKNLCLILDLRVKEMKDVLARLSNCGVYHQDYEQLFDIEIEPDGMVRYTPGTAPALEEPLLLTGFESLALRLAIKPFTDAVSPPFDHAADVLLNGIRSNTTKTQSLDIEYFNRVVALSASSVEDFDSFHNIATCVPPSRIRVEHRNTDGSTKLVIVPQRIVLTPGGWLLHAYDPDCKQMLELRMENLTFLENMEPDA